MESPLRLYDTDGERVAEITTDGSTLKPFINALRPIVDEARIHFEPDGIRARAVNPSNVVAIEVKVPAAAFDKYDVTGDGYTAGVNIGAFGHLIRRARMGSDDVLDLRVAERRMYASVARGYDGTNVVTDDRIDLIDPDSIRQEPDLPSLEMHTLTVGKDAFFDATEHASGTHDILTYELDSGDLALDATADTMVTEVRIEDVAPEDADDTVHMDENLLSDVLTSIRRSKADDLTVELGHELPMYFHFDRHRDGEPILLGEMMQAPRIQKENPTDD